MIRLQHDCRVRTPGYRRSAPSGAPFRVIVGLYRRRYLRPDLRVHDPEMLTGDVLFNVFRRGRPSCLVNITPRGLRTRGHVDLERRLRRLRPTEPIRQAGTDSMSGPRKRGGSGSDGVRPEGSAQSQTAPAEWLRTVPVIMRPRSEARNAATLAVSRVRGDTFNMVESARCACS